MRSLYELTGDYRAAYDLLTDPDIPESEALALLDGIAGEIGDKADSYAAIIADLKADAEKLKAEKSRLAAKQKSLENREASLKQRLMYAMEATGETKIKTLLHSFSIQNTKDKVKVTDLDAALASGFIKDIQPDETWLDKDAILNTMKSGETVPGCEIEQGRAVFIR